MPKQLKNLKINKIKHKLEVIIEHAVIKMGYIKFKILKI